MMSLEEEKFHREQKKMRSAGRYDKTSSGGKLKNETSARKAVRGKIRYGKSVSEMTPEEIKVFRKKLISSRNQVRRSHDIKRAVYGKGANENEDQNVGTKATDKGAELADDTIYAVQRHHYSKRIKQVKSAEEEYSGSGGKLGRNAHAANERVGQDAGDAGKTSKMIQKNRMKKEFQSAANKIETAENANRFGSISKKFTDKAEDLMGRFGEFISETLAEHPLAAVVIISFLLLILILSASLSSCGMIGGGAENTMVATSYTADDDQILAAEADYKEKEKELQEKVDNIKNEHPGYDEYQLNMAEINHNPYQLAAVLTVLYENYMEEEVQDKLQELFEAQYELTMQPVTEIRTRTEERTGHRTVHHSDGTTSQESYTYEVEVEYEYHILKCTLTNATMDAVIRSLGLTDNQMERYEILLKTQGNKPYLFGDDIYAKTDAGDYQDYDIPAEELTDTQFANMIAEGEKYLGMEYAWGGSSPSTGFDCSGFVSWVINHSGNGWNIGRQSANGLLGCCTKISESEAKPGDLVFFQGTYDTSGASHVAIYVGNGMILHCGNPIQYTSINTNYWQSHMLCYGRIND